MFPRRQASILQGYLPALNLLVFIYTPRWREALQESSVLPKNRLFTAHHFLISYIFNKLTSVFHVSVLLLMINCIITFLAFDHFGILLLLLQWNHEPVARDF